MLQMETFVRDDVFPSWFANALGRALSTLAQQFELVKSDNTHVQVPAAADGGAAIISIGGLWRWNEATLTVAHPGGVAGVYPVFVTAAANQIDAVPQPFTDDTNYAFALAILAPGATPAINAGVVDVYRHVGDAHWDGAAITRVDQLVPLAPMHAGRHVVGGADPLSPADIGAVPAADPATTQPGDLIFSGAVARAGCVLCDGRALNRVGTYGALFAAIGTTYGAGDGAATFNVPDFRGRTIVGAGAGGALTNRLLGYVGGEETHALGQNEMAVHNHGVADPGHVHAVISTDEPTAPLQRVATTAPDGVGTGRFTLADASGGAPEILTNSVATGVTVNDAGAGMAHNNMPPFGTANVFIKY